MKSKEDNGLLPVGVKEPKTEERRLAGGRGAEWEWQRVIGGGGDMRGNGTSTGLLLRQKSQKSLKQSNKNALLYRRTRGKRYTI